MTASHRITFVIAIGIFLLAIILFIYFFYHLNDQIVDDPKLNAKKHTYAIHQLGHLDLYAEYHRLIRTSVDNKNEYPIGYRIIEYNKALKTSKISTLNWIERGPSNVGGRTRALIVDPDDPNRETIWAGSVSGGLWKTTDGGRSWHSQTDHFPSLSVSSLVMAESDHNIIYLGTGGDAWSEPVNGLGIFRSSDRGETWEHLASTMENQDFVDVYRLLIDPENPNIVMAATNGGIFRTSDSGLIWDNVCCSTKLTHFTTLIAQPRNFDMQIAVGEYTFPFYSLDAGSTWQQTYLPLAESPPQRTEIAFSPSDPNIVYAATYDTNSSNLYKSNDGGITWISTVDDLQFDWMVGAGDWRNAIAVHPFNPNTVFVGGVQLHRILVSDITTIENRLLRMFDFEIDVEASAHADHHVIAPVIVDSINKQFWIFNANDGGIAVSFDNGIHFTELDLNASGYNTSQFYGISKKPGANVYIGGTQDNGTWMSNNLPEKNSEWENHLWGDGFETIWHSTDPELLLGSLQYSAIYKSVDGGNSWGRLPDMIKDRELGQFFTTLSNNDTSPNDVYTTKQNGVYYSRNFGDSWTHVPINTLWNCRHWGTIRVSKADPSIIWAGCGFISHYTSYHLSKNRGEAFSNISFPDIPRFVGGYSSGIATHPTEPATAYALFSQHGSPKVLETRDFGESWRDLSTFGDTGESQNGFPDVAVYDMIVMPHAPNTLWVGTEIGVFQSTNRGQDWFYMDDQLPPVAIWRMKVRDNEVIIGTHGRGVWTVPLHEIETLAFVDQVGDQTLTEGISITPVQLPEAVGSRSTLSYTIEPDLPSGLIFDNSTRTFYGTPTSTLEPTVYTYSVVDTRSKSVSLNFEISVSKPVAFHHLIENQSYPRAYAIDPLILPTAYGGAPPITYSLTPMLPEGLLFTSSTRTITGIPKVVTDATTYYYHATDVNGSIDSQKFNLLIYSPVDVQTQSLPITFDLLGNYPNPFTGKTQIMFDLPYTSEVSVDIFDLTGARVRQIPAVIFEAGWKRVIDFNGNGLSSGLYLYSVQAISSEQTVTINGNFIHIH